VAAPRFVVVPECRLPARRSENVRLFALPIRLAPPLALHRGVACALGVDTP
jgi:hypothetical protein